MSGTIAQLVEHSAHSSRIQLNNTRGEFLIRSFSLLSSLALLAAMGNRVRPGSNPGGPIWVNR